MPVSGGSYSNGVLKYELANATSAIVNNNIYFAQRGSVNRDAAYGWRPYQTGFALEVSAPVKLTFNVKSNTTSSRTITGQAYTVIDPLFYVWKNTEAGASLETYVTTVNSKAEDARTDEEKAIHNTSALAAITSSSDNNKKKLTCESPDNTLATKHGGAINHSCPATKGGTNSFDVTLSAAGRYVIYLTSSGGSVGITSIDIDPLYQLTWALDGGTITSSSSEYTVAGLYAAGTTLTAPTVTKTNHNFTGWSPAVAETMPAAATTYTATWEAASSVDVTYNNGGHGVAPSSESDVASVTLSEITGVSGWRNTGWKADVATTVDASTVAAGTEIANGKTVYLSANTTFTAQWIQIFTVTYYDGASSLGTEQVEDGEYPTEYATYESKANHHFDGWFNNSDLAPAHAIADISTYSITANTPVYGKWTPVYSVTYNANGGSGTVPTQDDLYEGDDFVVASGSTLSRVCYSFAGWNTEEDGTGAAYSAGDTYADIAEDVTLYAQWTGKYTNGNYDFQASATMGSSPSKTITTSDETYDPFYIDNIYVSTMKLAYDDGSTSSTGDGDNYNGWKFKTKNGTFKFLVEKDKCVTIGIGTIGSNGAAKIDYTNLSGVATSTSLTAATNNQFFVKGGTMVTITHNGTDGKTVTLKKIFITDCVSLSDVDAAEYGFATFCGDNSFTVSGATAYKASLSGTTLTLTSLGSKKIPANNGVILVGDPGETATITYTSEGDAADMTGNDLLGTTSRTLSTTLLAGGADKVMVLDKTDNTFKSYTGAGKYIPANKAYLLYDEPEGAPSAIRIEFGENNATNMGNIKATDEAVKFIQDGKLFIKRNGVVYDAVGRVIR